MMRLISLMMKLPVAAFVYTMEMAVKTLQGLQRITDHGIDTMIAATAHHPENTFQGQGCAGARGSVPTSLTHQPGDVNHFRNDTDPVSGGARMDGDPQQISKEERVMDKDLHDDMLKLVRYKVLFVRREYEVAFAEKEDLVSDNMDGTAFTAWKTAEFIQELAKEATRVPTKWQSKGYPSAEKEPRDGEDKKVVNRYIVDRNGEKYLKGLPDEDKKYLRVYYEVLERYPREKFKYEEQQIRVLEQIRDKMVDQ